MMDAIQFKEQTGRLEYEERIIHDTNVGDWPWVGDSKNSYVLWNPYLQTKNKAHNVVRHNAMQWMSKTEKYTKSRWLGNMQWLWVTIVLQYPTCHVRQAIKAAKDFWIDAKGRNLICRPNLQIEKGVLCRYGVSTLISEYLTSTRWAAFLAIWGWVAIMSPRGWSIYSVLSEAKISASPPSKKTLFSPGMSFAPTKSETPSNCNKSFHLTLCGLMSH